MPAFGSIGRAVYMEDADTPRVVGVQSGRSHVRCFNRPGAIRAI